MQDLLQHSIKVSDLSQECTKLGYNFERLDPCCVMMLCVAHQPQQEAGAVDVQCATFGRQVQEGEAFGRS
jgi:hypothetical protein